MGRFNRRFEDLGTQLDDTQWLEEMSTVMKAEVIVQKEREKPKGKSKK
jgi:hypothetical protein